MIDRADEVWRSQNYMAVIELMDRVLAWDPGNTHARNIRTEAQERIRRIDEGIQAARDLLHENGDLSAARRMIEEVLELDRDNKEALGLRVEAGIKQVQKMLDEGRDLAAARHEIDLVLELDPRNRQARSLRTEILEHLSEE